MDTNNTNLYNTTDYYPFGTAFSVANTTKNKYLYGGKEYQDEVIGGTLLGMYDFEARFADTRLGVFTTPDPLREKYFGISPYAYCANNPILLTDPTGKTLVIHYNNEAYTLDASNYFHLVNGENTRITHENTFVNAFIQTFNYMLERGTAGNLLEIIHSSQAVDLKEIATGDNYFEINGSTNTIYWDPFSAIEHPNGTHTSPATHLEHELAHANGWLTDPKGYLARGRDKSDPNWKDMEEKRVVTGSEQKAAVGHGDIFPWEVTRDSYRLVDGPKYKVHQVSSPTSNGLTPMQKLSRVVPSIKSYLKKK